MASRSEFQSSHGSLSWQQYGEGPPLLFLHGTPFSSCVWARIAPVFRNDFCVFLVDLLGYGQSDKPAKVSLDVVAASLAELAEALFTTPPFVIAHDFGGVAALRMHLLHGIDFRFLAMMNPVAVGDWGTPFMRHVRHHEGAFSGLPTGAHEGLFRAYVDTSIDRPLSDEEFRVIFEPWSSREGQAAFYRQIAQADRVFTDEIRDAIPALRCDYSLLWSLDDQWLPVAHADELEHLKEPAVSRRFSGAGHLMQLDAPEEVISFILESQKALSSQSVGVAVD